MADRTYVRKSSSTTAPAPPSRFRSAPPPQPVQAGASEPPGFADPLERAERLGHRFAPPSGEAPVQRVEIPAEERAKPEEFMRARAHLAAVLTGASTGELQTEVQSSRERVNQWDSTEETPVTEEQAQGVYGQTLANDYVTAKRFQNEAGHFKPRQQQGVTAVDQVRALHGGTYHATATESPLEHFGAAYLGARHTKGHNDSSFVSLAKDPESLLTSKDDGAKGAQTIAKKAAQLHTYTFPKVFGWDTDRLSSTLEQEDGTLDEPIDPNGQTFGEWLGSTPREEGEVLFHGGNLDKYRTRQEANPFLPKKGKPGRGGKGGKGGPKKGKKKNV